MARAGTGRSVAEEAVVAVRRNSLGPVPRTRLADGAHDLCTRLAARYWDLDDPALADVLAQLLATDQVRLVIHPETVSRYML